MDPSSPDYFRQLRLSCQLILLALCNRASQAIYCTAALAFRHVFQESLIWPRGLLDLIKCLSAAWFLKAYLPNLRLLSSVMFPPRMEEDFEIEFGRPMPRRALFAIPALWTAIFVATFWYLLKRPNIFWVPILAFSTEPIWVVRSIYAVAVLSLTNGLTPLLRIGLYGPSVTAWLAHYLVSPYEAWIKWKMRRLADTFIAGPTLRTKRILPIRPFSYDPIDEPGVVRLLRLEPLEGRMSATLGHYPISNCPPYWAVSYVWGRAVFDHVLFFGTQDLPITASCAGVLDLLTPLRTRYLWIDAICINQADNAEKATQISLMAAIYSRAEQVVGCLRTSVLPDDIISAGQMSSGFLFDLIRYLRFTEPMVSTINKVVAPLALRLPFRHQVHNWRGFAILLAHPYWERAWIMQEMVLARRLIFVYGEASFSWKNYRYAVNGLFARAASGRVPNMDEIHRFVPVMFANLTGQSDRIDMVEGLKRELEGVDRSQWPPLARVMDQIYKVEATDQRDQVFALLNLSSDGGEDALKPDYREAVTYQDVVTRVMLYSLSKGQMNPLLAAGLAYRPEGDPRYPRPNLPSWLPVYPTALRQRTTNPVAQAARKATFHLQYGLSNDQKELSLLGVVVDEVAALCSVSLALPPNEIIKRYMAGRGIDESTSFHDHSADFWAGFQKRAVSMIPSFMLAARKLASEHTTDLFSGSGSNNYYRFMTMDWDGLSNNDASSTPTPAWPLFADLERTMLLEDEEALKHLENVTNMSSDREIENGPLQHWSHYELVATKGQRLAWVPPGTKVGNLLCRLTGTELPFVLKPAGECRFELVGEGYMQTTMTGEDMMPDPVEEWLKIV